LDVNPQQAKPFTMHGRAVSVDFFSTFQAPFRSGSPWSSSLEAHRARVVVLGADLAQRLFPLGNAVGSDLNLNERNYRIVGVLGPWNPSPRVVLLLSRLAVIWPAWRAASIPPAIASRGL